MPRLREAPEESTRLLESIDREIARLSKRKRMYFAAGQTENTTRTTNRLRMLAHLRAQALPLVQHTRWTVPDPDAIADADAPDALVLPINGHVAVEWPTATTEPLDEDDLLEGLV
jgi:hypothetical protein